MPMGMGQGMYQDATAGATAGGGIPGVGTVVGAATGGVSGLIGDLFNRKERKKAERASRPKHRRMTAIQEAMNAYREQKLAGQLTMAQSAFDWSNNLRL